MENFKQCNHRNFKQTTWVADSRCCHCFMKMNFLMVTGKKELYTHRSRPPPPNRHMLWKSRTNSPLLQYPRAQSCQFCWRKIHGGKSRGRTDWADSGAANPASVRNQHLPNHSIPQLHREPHSRAEPSSDCHQLMDWQTVSTHIPILG